ncbi:MULTISPECIES: gamma-glutamyl-gamma-aminobutyrate hydrolase family protein [Rhizobium/Agrobacterium group]|uniref:gamma-glutamyl-gamma-aminobutyrate hydrolase family protein n=1 Tax=Rhizobium/Agrobacterium group TaxID=227290 RepID=UPI000B3F7BC4|nr:MULTISPECIES: gamma-glutamyl-gamma-aminobutyrate hydrolase family protein [Rhizobium/Agrobacterium group]MCF1484086.1 hypothetical protein [Allorhizobium ampelinum]NSZ45743.1 C26 family cysteine hydrolase domain-containing family [Agrobacterium vitis]NTA29459.1 C26 family cysteine hydrolase domain-containing family [Allorhizobium ampelinum]OVE88453.1 hypothetical protein B7W85_23620 [Allorhizobium ampelinum]
MSRFVAITMRDAVLPERNEHRDCLETGWWTFLEACEFVPVCLPNHLGQAEFILDSGILSGVILSGGGNVARSPEHALARDRVEDIVLDRAKEKGLPVLGVCRGLQKLCHAFGGTLVERAGHTVTKHRIAGNWGERCVNSYHDYGIDEVPSQCHVLAEAEDGSPEWLAHDSLPVSGIMWHPERNVVPDQADIALFRARFSTIGCH